MTNDRPQSKEKLFELIGRVEQKVRSRREFMNGAAKVGTGAAALSTIGAGTAAANNDESSSDVSDIDILNYALTLEHLEAAYYREFLDEYDEHDVERSEIAKYFARPTLRYSLYQQIQDIGDHEQQHVDKLTATIKKLGGTPVGAAEYEFPYDSIEGFVAVADRLESVGVSAYAGAAPLLSNPDLIPPALSIHSVEANHWTFFNFLDLRRAAPNAFNPARTMDQVLPIAKKFIVGVGGNGGGGGNEKSLGTTTVQLTGDKEVPPVDTNASGSATLELLKQDGTYKLDYDLTVMNIDNVTQAHIHLGQPGENGPVVAYLFGPDKSGVSKNGQLSSGTITESDLVGPLKGKSIQDLKSMTDKGAYVNVHTKAHPDGEIRGQILLS